jgi:hypothetical protein
MGSAPVVDFLGFPPFGVIDPDGELGKERHGVGPSERVEQLEQQPSLFALPHPPGDLLSRVEI